MQQNVVIEHRLFYSVSLAVFLSSTLSLLVVVWLVINEMKSTEVHKNFLHTILYTTRYVAAEIIIRHQLIE